MDMYKKSHKVKDVCYDIRGPVLVEANKMQEKGQKIIKLNIGNTAPFSLFAPGDVLDNVIKNIPNAQGYCDSKGILSTRGSFFSRVS